MTTEASDIHNNSATLYGEVSSCVGKVLEYGFYWGDSVEAPNKLLVGSADTITEFEAELADLKPGEYYFKAFATNSKGTGYGRLLHFEIMDKNAIKVILNGRRLSFDVEPVIENDRTLVPLRVIFEALGAEVAWDGEAKMVTAVKEGLEIKLFIDGAAYKNGELVILDVPAKIINDRTMVPLRFVSEAMGCQVKWTESTRTVNITQ